MNIQVTDYIAQAPEEQRKIMEQLRELIHREVPGATENFKWSRPVFTADGDFAYFKTAKAYVTLGFFKSEKIEDHSHLLEGTGKDMRHFKIRNMEAVQPEIISKWIEQVNQ